ncbi:polyprenol phosphomannose-dependent alpha 1,6 mannosyltransferase MptB [Actinomadura rudentiformis]|uniref:DUF2029 domain-containing protein n=1 Tax=Actinomadura rudentiformis TaxID=359158 RepID=A0A6H9YU05_9ACTN|nr:polyprenol phosphomannose-dependent alpha 1,6 mannosyltransferase MptB [Actinomadura rudentiformis]KAB2344788.1 hypothetical protein F8566_29745 [Actinomadura rudentiformis]
MTSAGRDPRSLGTAGLISIGGSAGCFLLTALLGPSAMEPALPGEPGQPPYSLTVHPSPYLVIGLVVMGIAAGVAGLGLCFTAVQRGWRPRPFPLLIAGLLVTAAFTLMPPIGSADHLNYAAYGRMAATGHDPYTTRAVDLPGDPVIGAVEEWRTAPSVYGPIATAQEAFASWIGGGSMRLTVFMLSFTNALAFVITALVLYRSAGGPQRRLRGVLLWTCNPLLLFHLVAGAHNDVLAIAPMVAAVALYSARRRHKGAAGVLRVLATGALVGAGAAIKLPAALVGGGPAWVLARRTLQGRVRMLRHDRGMQDGDPTLQDGERGVQDGKRGVGDERGVGGWRDVRGRIGGVWGWDRGALLRLVALFGAAGGVALVSFSLAGPHAFDQLEKASNMVSFATPWHLVDMLLGKGGQRTIIKIGFFALTVVLVWLLARGLPRDGDVEESRRIAAALVLAWLFAAPYELPWYDGFGWAVLAFLPWSRFDWILLAHTGALSLAYLPARDPKLIGLPGGLSWLFTVVRPVVIPLVLTGLLIVLVRECRRSGRPAPAPGCSPRASAGSRG